MYWIPSSRSMRFSYFLLQPFLILVLHFVVLKLSGEPGGSVGMVPLLAIYAITFQMAIVLFLYLIVGVLLRYRNSFIWIGAGAFVFELATIEMMGTTSLMGLFQQGTDRVINLSFLLPNILATTIMLLVAAKF